MSRKVSPIEEINDTKETWKLEARIMHLWYVQRSGTVSTIEMLFIDKQGDKIHAVVKNSYLDKWKNDLQEGNTYIVQNLEVKINDGHYKTCRHRYKLFFTEATIVRAHDLPTIPIYLYNFTTFEDIISGHATEDVLIDVIGEYVDLVHYQPESKPKKMVFCMTDSSGRTLNCTLWGAYATQLLSFLDKREPGHIVIVLTLAKIKDSQGKYPVAIQNSMYGSKLLINENITEIQEYKNSLDSNRDCDSHSQRLAQMSSCSQLSSKNSFLKNAQIKSITEINALKQECYYITVAQIDKMFPRNGWYYEGCSRCKRKVEPFPSSNTCSACGNDTSQTTTLFRIEVSVSDNNESSKFILWDQECRQLINETAVNLKKKLSDEGELDPFAVPEDVDNILKKTLAFKVKVQPNYKRSSVVMLSEDSQFIESTIQKIMHHEESSINDKGKSIWSATTDHDSCDNHSYAYSATADYDPDLLGSLTPAKRLASELQFDDLATKEMTSAQLSSTKMTKNIKTE